jgi:geranylgeranyl pyrophosphate synthase
MKQSGITPKTAVALVDSKAMVDAFLAPFLHQLTENARRINPHYETLWQDIHTLYAAGGKRLRSYMTLLTYQAYSGLSPETVLPAAASQELLHIAMLIHDDIIDRDVIRYGVKNVTQQYLDHYQELIPNAHDRRHYAESAAILAGDLLISQAYDLVAETKVDAALIIKAQRLLSKAMFQVIGGELLDTEAAFRGLDSADPLIIAEQKTASYSFVSPLLMGATLAQASPIQHNILRTLGEQLGIAYQLRDDLLGVFGSSSKTGKSVDGDIKEGKRTLLIEAFRRLATEAQTNEFNTVFGRQDASPKDIDRIKVLLTESGAKASIEKLITEYQEYAHNLLQSLDIDNQYHDAFGQLIDLCVKREK